MENLKYNKLNLIDLAKRKAQQVSAKVASSKHDVKYSRSLTP